MIEGWESVVRVSGVACIEALAHKNVVLRKEGTVMSVYARRDGAGKIKTVSYLVSAVYGYALNMCGKMHCYSYLNARTAIGGVEN